jgi:hypothetical protein
MTTLASIRADDVNFPLFLHVLGAMLLVGTLFAVTVGIVLGWRREEGEAVALTRFGLLTLLLGVLPAYILMRIGAEWTAVREGFNEEGAPEPTWLGLGYITADAGALLILVSLVLGAIGLVRMRRGGGGGVALGRAVGIICLVLLAAYVVTVWAMSGKPD